MTNLLLGPGATGIFGEGSLSSRQTGYHLQLHAGKKKAVSASNPVMVVVECMRKGAGGDLRSCCRQQDNKRHDLALLTSRDSPQSQQET